VHSVTRFFISPIHPSWMLVTPLEPRTARLLIVLSERRQDLLSTTSFHPFLSARISRQLPPSRPSLTKMKFLCSSLASSLDFLMIDFPRDNRHGNYSCPPPPSLLSRTKEASKQLICPPIQTRLSSYTFDLSSQSPNLFKSGIYPRVPSALNPRTPSPVHFQLRLALHSRKLEPPRTSPRKLPTSPKRPHTACENLASPPPPPPPP